MPPDACPRNPAKSGHWWIIDTPSGRFSSGYCKYCNATRNNYFDNVWEPVFGHDARDPRKEPELTLSADERTKRHDFYEKKKPEIIATYNRLKNTKATAEELTRKWGCDAPTTTIYGLLQKWGIVHKRTPKKARSEKKKAKPLALAPEVAAGSPPAPLQVTGMITYLEVRENGIIRMVIEAPSGSRFRIGGSVEISEL